MISVNLSFFWPSISVWVVRGWKRLKDLYSAFTVFDFYFLGIFQACVKNNLRLVGEKLRNKIRNILVEIAKNEEIIYKR